VLIEPAFGVPVFALLRMYSLCQLLSERANRASNWGTAARIYPVADRRAALARGRLGRRALVKNLLASGCGTLRKGYGAKRIAVTELAAQLRRRFCEHGLEREAECEPLALPPTICWSVPPRSRTVNRCSTS